MANDVTHLLDMLYNLIDEAKGATFGQGKCTINRDEALDFLDEIRAQMPVELKRAQELIRAREEYVESAKRDVERLMRQAEVDAKSKISESEIIVAAREKGRNILRHAEERAREMYRVTNEYTEDALRRTEEAITMALGEVRHARSNFRAASAEKMQQQKELIQDQKKLQEQVEKK